MEAIVALPTEIFFRTGIGTYLWILSNKKPKHRRNQLQLLNATSLWTSIKNEGNKRRMISEDQIRQIADLYAASENTGLSRMLDYRSFGYRRIRVLRPLRMSLHIDAESLAKLRGEKVWAKLTELQQAAWNDALAPYVGQVLPFAWAETFVAEITHSTPEVGKVGKTFAKTLINAFGMRDPDGEPVQDSNGQLVSDSELTDYENIPLLERIEDYVAREVLPHLPDAYIDETFRDEKDKQVGKVGYEINFNRYFYQYVPPRNLHDIDAELKAVEAEIAALLAEVATA